jgi:hypothetical protein
VIIELRMNPRAYYQLKTSTSAAMSRIPVLCNELESSGTRQRLLDLIDGASDRAERSRRCTRIVSPTGTSRPTAASDHQAIRANSAEHDRGHPEPTTAPSETPMPIKKQTFAAFRAVEVVGKPRTAPRPPC